ncbi:DegT/DnrJ/EryC1/StrS family aminotransferase [Blastococcus sp. Marseille-P5729]|uniref:DegT/DnrJ/EryC1/StrS family aminotransferase n=1 Tax=Blastococcus sp. Marseille-P5729 TaxID=2086582 RepID=UPI00351A9427
MTEVSRRVSEAERIYLSSPDVGDDERAALLRAVDGGWIAPLGPEVDAFERELAARCGRGHAVALSSGTAALHLALLEAGARPGRIVIVPTMTFVATANAAHYTGAQVVFVDCEPETGNLSPELLQVAIETLRAEGEDIAAVVPVDLLGRCADYSRLEPLAAHYRIPLVSDAAESLGANHRGKPAGSFGQSAVLSFNGNKIITTSGGGALVTDDEVLAERVRYLSTQARQPARHYEHSEIGFNYRMSNLLAALGRAQLSRLESMMATRRAHREHYAELFAQAPGIEIFQRDGDLSDNCWLTAILVDESVERWDADEIVSSFAAAGLETRPLWKPMHLQPVFRGRRSFTDGSAERLFRTGITMPSGSALTPTELNRIDDAVMELLKR